MKINWIDEISLEQDSPNSKDAARTATFAGEPLSVSSEKLHSALCKATLPAMKVLQNDAGYTKRQLVPAFGDIAQGDQPLRYGNHSKQR